MTMPQSFLFSFGFESPEERRSNERSGTDFESSWSVRIAANSGEEAIDWGRQVAETFVRRLYQNAGMPDRSWIADGFAHWIEESEDHGEDAPSVTVGEMPNFDWALKRFA
ncbi:MAG: hypothetical protein NT015_00615 [Alphaproteobacteria bacterium]|nr:hypothetical protein [Alphaproteobacteria bacterium]